jgi:hypothetical protein
MNKGPHVFTSLYRTVSRVTEIARVVENVDDVLLLAWEPLAFVVCSEDGLVGL